MTSYARGFAPQQVQQQPRQSFGQQMQSTFGGFGMPQQQQGFGGGFGMPQQRFGGFGGYGMPQQQQGFGNIFARTMPPQQVQQPQGFGPGVNNYSRPPQQNFGGGFSPESITSFPATPPRQQGLGGSLGSFFGRQGFNMPQSEGGMDAGMGAYNQASAERNMAARAAQANQPPTSVQDLANLLRGNSQSAAPQPVPPQMPPPPMPPQQEARIDPNTYTRSPFNLEGDQQAPMDRMQRQQQLMQQAQMPGNPYAQQIGQEDPRMQAMRYMQRMRFGGGGGGYNF